MKNGSALGKRWRAAKFRCEINGNVGAGMFPAARDTDKLPDYGIRLFVLLALICPGCVLPWNTRLADSSRNPATTALQSQASDEDKGVSRIDVPSGSDVVQITTDSAPSATRVLPEPALVTKPQSPAYRSIGGGVTANRLRAPQSAVPRVNLSPPARAVASKPKLRSATAPSRNRTPQLITQAGYESAANSTAGEASAHMSVVVMQPAAPTPLATDAQPAGDAQVDQSPPSPAEAPEAPSSSPPPAGPIRIPLAGQSLGNDIEMTMKDGKVTLVTRNAPVQSILNLLAEQQGLNLIAAEDVTANVSVTLTNVAYEDALNAIVSIAGCTWTQQHGIMLVSKIGGETQGTPDVQGKIVQVFPLNFIAAVDIEPTIKGLISPVGQVFTSQTSVADKRRTQELVVVEDMPASVARICQYIEQVDQPPRQVMIEAHVLQVDLKDDTRHGVNWDYITKWVGRDIALKTVGFANPTASPASIFSLDGEHLDLVIEALKTTTDAKTLASPKVIVANGQEARIQIGSKLGYFVTTTTQTSTLQNVNFLNTGVLLKVTPQISNDGRVLMVVAPEVSTGRISAAGLPETNTTEALTTVLLENNGGMVIGGLIKESDSDTQDKVPVLGDLWMVGRLFQKRSIARQRSEIIIVLVPHIAPYLPDGQAAEQTEIYRATTPIFENGLVPLVRPLDPALPDAVNTQKRNRFFKQAAKAGEPWPQNQQANPRYYPPDAQGTPYADPAYEAPYFEPSAADPQIDILPPPPIASGEGIDVPAPPVPVDAAPADGFLAPIPTKQN